MKDDHFAHAQGALFGDDERVVRTSEIVRKSLEAMPHGRMLYQRFVSVADFISCTKYPTFLRLVQVWLAGYGKVSDEHLAIDLARVVGDLPNLETVARTRRDMMHEPQFKGKVMLIAVPVLKKQKLKVRKTHGRKH